MPFLDRSQAGEKLVLKLRAYKNKQDTVILALPRGGVMVAAPVARYLHVPLDIILVRKIGAPGYSEYAIGAIAEPDVFVPNEFADYDFESPEVKKVLKEEEEELERRSKVYRQGRARIPLKNKIVILVDDGLATGTTMKAAIVAVKREKPSTIVVAVPVSAPDTAKFVSSMVDVFIALETPAFFSAVGQFYADFPQNTDEEVVMALSYKP